MKILHIITSLHTGGAEKLIVDIAPKLKNLGHTVDVLLFDGSNTPFKQQLTKLNVNILTLSNGGSVYNPLHICKLIPILRRYDIIHTHNTAPQLFAAIANLFCRKKLITTEHSTTNRRRNWWWYKPIDRFMYNQYEKIICISDQAEKNLRSYLGKCRADIVTIYNGVDITKYASATASNELQIIAPNCRAIVMVAGFRYQKDQDTLIRATALLPQQFHTFFIGDGERKQQCEVLAQTEGIADRVHFMGIRMNIPELLKAADYVVLSSHWEGFGLAAVEGMCASKPVIVSNVKGLAQVVDGAGVIFDLGNAQQLASEILKLDNDPLKYKEIALSCLNRSCIYDISNMINKYNQLYIYGVN